MHAGDHPLSVQIKTQIPEKKSLINFAVVVVTSSSSSSSYQKSPIHNLQSPADGKTFFWGDNKHTNTDISAF